MEAPSDIQVVYVFFFPLAAILRSNSIVPRLECQVQHSNEGDKNIKSSMCCTIKFI